MQQTRTNPLWAPPLLLVAFAGIILSAMSDYRVYVLRTSQLVLGALVLIQLGLAVLSFRAQHGLRGVLLIAGAGLAGFMTYALQYKPLFFSVTPDVFVMAAPIVAAALCLFAFSPPAERP